MIVCLRTVDVPPTERDRFLEWIDENRAIRQEHGIIFELVLERPDGPETARRIAERRTSDEGQEGLTAFLERRSPGWAEAARDS